MTESNIQSKSRNDVLLFFIWQCIVSAFCILIINIFEKIDENSNTTIGIMCFLKNIVIFFSFLFLNKLNLDSQSLKKTLLILSIFVIPDAFMYWSFCTHEPIYLCAFVFLTINYLPFLMSHRTKKIVNYIDLKYSINVEIIKYIVILICLLFINILIPFIIFSFTFTIHLSVWVFFGICYIILFPPLIPVVAIFVGILLEKQAGYVKYIAPKLKYILLIGILIDIFLFKTLKGFSIKPPITIPFSFTLTFVPLYIVYLLDRLYKYLKNKFVK